jgi:tetratricopeptide (TPR) repeat protein
MKILHAAVSIAALTAATAASAQAYGYSKPQTNSAQADSQGNADSSQAKSQKAAPKPSGKAMKSIIALNNAATGKDAAAFAAALPEAKANAANAGDNYLIGMLMMNMAIGANDVPGMAAAVDQIAQSGYLPTAEVAGLYQSLAGTLNSAKQPEQAAAALQKGLALDPNNLDLMTSLAETDFSANKVADGIIVLRKAIALKAAAEGKAPENYYKRGVGMAYGAKLPVAMDLTREWVAAYPNPDSWHNALAIYQNMTQRTPALSLEIYRLMAATNSLTAQDYVVYAASAFDAGNYVESQAALDAGIAAGKIRADSADAKDVLDALKAKPKATAADLEVAAKSVTDAKGRMRVGDRYLGMGNYAEAIALYRAADGQPGIDQDLLKLHLGAALARSGDKAGAKAVFQTVGGAWKPMATYWLLYTG